MNDHRAKHTLQKHLPCQSSSKQSVVARCRAGESITTTVDPRNKRLSNKNLYRGSGLCNEVRTCFVNYLKLCETHYFELLNALFNLNTKSILSSAQIYGSTLCD
ncbi:hypothetical protein J6590_079934 [Homalodisca vitripennis]|nr:hypothetical protein J6590_079934 [Homalodisca vitripennis]